MRLILSLLITLLFHACGTSSCPPQPASPAERTGMEVSP